MTFQSLASEPVHEATRPNRRDIFGEPPMELRERILTCALVLAWLIGLSASSLAQGPLNKQEFREQKKAEWRTAHRELQQRTLALYNDGRYEEAEASVRLLLHGAVSQLGPVLRRGRQPGGEPMTSYLLVDLVIHDEGGFQEYRSRVPEFIANYGGEYLVRGGAGFSAI